MKRGKLAYITIPEAVRDHFAGYDFLPDPAIPLPVEIPPDWGKFEAENLSPEMFLAGMLMDLAENPGGQHSAYYRKLVTAVKPGILGELQGAAMLKARNGDYPAALEVIALLEGLYPRHPGLLLSRALVLEEKAFAAARTANSKEAERAFGKAEAAYEQSLAFPLPDTLFSAGLFYERREDYRRASDCLRAYLESGEDGPRSGETSPGNGVEDKKIRARKILEEIRGSGLDNDVFLEALTLIRQNREEEGILKAKEFLEHHPGSGRGWFVLGWGLRRLARWEDGAACFEKALELGQAYPDIRNELAICRMESGDLDGARRELEKALHRDPDNVKIISNLGILALKRGEDDKAAAFFRTVLELEPGDPIAKAFLPA
ncbi:MAG: tetratricopeptide repeat protein [Spirochaetaceae bacterium]|jgi:tetratricopeptide (TPR) repeat protein|nr:tetratricopeptide repeat protein [Spirochaetaceae bacterium]